MNGVGKGFFEEKMANLKVFIVKVCETYRATLVLRTRGIINISPNTRAIFH